MAYFSQDCFIKSSENTNNFYCLSFESFAGLLQFGLISNFKKVPFFLSSSKLFFE